MGRLNKGQSLVELLIGVGITVVVMITAMTLLQFLLRMSAQDPVAQTGAFLAHQAIRAVTVAAEGSWSTIASAAGLGGVHHAREVVSGSGFVLASGPAITTVNAIPYTIAITVLPVNRFENAIHSSMGAPDPSTKKVIATVSWTQGGSIRSSTLESYVARTRNEVLWQTDWVGGATCLSRDTPVVAGTMTTQFCAASSMADYSTVPGSIKIKGL